MQPALRQQARRALAAPAPNAQPLQAAPRQNSIFFTLRPVLRQIPPDNVAPQVFTAVLPTQRFAPSAPPPVIAPTDRPTQRARVGSIKIDGIRYQSVGLADLRPGDICFTYKPNNKNWRQRFISLGERAVNRGAMGFHGNPDVVHAFLVLESFPLQRKLHVIDAAGGAGYVGIGRMVFNFTTPKKADDKHARYVIHRFADPVVRAMIMRLAMNWSAQTCRNFSVRRAAAAPFVHRSIKADTRRRWRHLARHVFTAKPVPALGGKGYYKVMCSEFIADIGGVAAMHAYCSSRDQKLTSRAALKGLRRGPAGQIFDGDPRGMLPSSLQARMARDPHMQVVGYLPTCAEMLKYNL